MIRRLVLLLYVLSGVTDAAEEGKPFYLPKNPRAAAYILGRLSQKELIEAPRSEPVFLALLERPGLDRKYRVEALRGLAKVRQTDALTELLKTLPELDQKGAISVLRELTPLLLQEPPAALADKREALEAIALEAHEPFTRQLAYAGLIQADQDLSGLWREREGPQLVDLVLAIPLLREAVVLEKCYARIESLLHKTTQPELRSAAIRALTSIPGHDKTTYATLAPFVAQEDSWLAAANGLQRLPKSALSQEQAELLVGQLMGHLKSLSPESRASDDAVGAAQLASDLASLLPRAKALTAQKALRALGVQVIVLRAIYEQMLYDKSLLIVEAGKPVQIIFQNDDAMQHNLVIVSPGAIEEVGKAAETLTPKPDAQGRVYIPDSPKILEATPLLNSGERAKLSFIAPANPGDYGYVCTYPGHWLRMRGTLRVVPDLDAYLASHAEPAEPSMTEWTFEQLAPELAKAGPQRDLSRGLELFNKLACAQCHKVGATGYAYGPNLDDVLGRWKGDWRGVLREVLEPSKVINDRYRTYEFELNDGESVSGMIVLETDQDITLQSGPSDALIQTLPKAKIVRRTPQSLSVMPVGLLYTLNKEQIIDLLSFVGLGAHHHE